MASFKFKKGDLVVVDEDGAQAIFEILSTPVADKRIIAGADICYDARHVVNGETKTIFEDEILRLATPVDNSAHLFRKEK